MCRFCDESDDEYHTTHMDSAESSSDYSTEDPTEDGYHDDSEDGYRTDTLQRVISPLEFEYLDYCRGVISRITGEKFIAGPTPWLLCRSDDGALQMMSDGYCQKFNMEIEYMGGNWDFSEEDVWQTALSSGIPIRVALNEMKNYVFKTRMAAAISAGVWRVYIPKPDDLPRVLGSLYSGETVEMTLGEATEEYIRRRLHQLTAFLPFIGGPKCACISRRDPNIASLSIRKMIRIERSDPYPGQSILDILKNSTS